MRKINLNINPKYKKYLPSKKFAYIILSFVSICIFVFIISVLLFGKSNFGSSKKEKNLITQKLTINELLQKDSDGDGVLDWEEGLWGTDPNNTRTFDMPDAEYIRSKREILQTPGGTGLSTELNETDKFAQQFFASLAALKQSGQLDSTTMQNMTTALGESITNPELVNNYTLQNLKINSVDSAQTQEEYYLKAGNMFESYKEKGVGKELEIVGTLVASGINTESEAKLNTIANAYQEYAQKMLSLSVPESLSSYHLKIINSSNNIGISVRNMNKIANDPIVGLSGVSQYQKYSEELVSAVGSMETILSINGIIQ
ncbi:MAG TPA: thrombospondin type 3 repeat-containing protein [Candidatus Paceibacterota bacterium]|nr:thrombospondin type 3 repeat-containing protein [Candidatus Paceibacterota bacterium]